MPGTSDLAAYADRLRRGIDAATDIPDDRFQKAHWYRPRPGEAGRSYSFATGMIGVIQGFDTEALSLFFGDLMRLCPDERMLIHVSTGSTGNAVPHTAGAAVTTLAEGAGARPANRSRALFCSDFLFAPIGAGIIAVIGSRILLRITAPRGG
ncbi:MAG: hypothetical protein ING10_12010 [Roseomonas sp.]|nr:hypothetical protein [Roseomonas sp.]